MYDEEKLIHTLQLTPHTEGGYYRRIYTSPQQHTSSLKLASSIYYLLTHNNPIGHLHRCKSDILHYFLEGDPLKYSILSEGKGLSVHFLSNQHRFLAVSGGDWKASELQGNTYALIAEVVVPEFCYEEREMAQIETFQLKFSQEYNQIKHLIKT